MASESNTYFTEQQVSQILKDASERQAAAGSERVNGLSAEDLHQIASELGIEPHHVEAALAAHAREEADASGYHLLGGPLSVDIERVVEGELLPDQWSELTTHISRTFNHVGQSSQVGRTLQWTAQHRFQQVHVALTPRGGKTKVRIFTKYERLAALTHAPLTILSMLGVLLPLEAGWSALGVVLAGMLIVGSVHMALRLAFGKVAASKREQAETVMQTIEQALAEAAAQPAPAPHVTSSLPSGLLDGVEEELSEEKMPIRRRTKA